MGAKIDLLASAAEEAVAAALYRDRAARARSEGNTRSAQLWEAIAVEEDEHQKHFRDRVTELECGSTIIELKDIVVGESALSEMERIGSCSAPGLMPPTGRLFPRTYGDWVELAEAIKFKDTEPTTAFMVNESLVAIGGTETDTLTPSEAKRYLVEKAGELGIK
jgi:hypothetical protein